MNCLKCDSDKVKVTPLQKGNSNWCQKCSFHWCVWNNGEVDYCQNTASSRSYCVPAGCLLVMTEFEP